jgi:hypothetical protein
MLLNVEFSYLKVLGDENNQVCWTHCETSKRFSIEWNIENHFLCLRYEYFIFSRCTS